MSAKKKSINDRLKIVIAEDSPTQAEQLKYILETNGCQVAAASNGKEALVLARSDRTDIVITDIVMPEMDGYELCKQIKMDEELKNVPVILLTALSDPADVIKGLECGADNFVTKPYDERSLLSRIEYLRLNWRLPEIKQVRMGVEITFSGRKYFITSDRLQILNLLISTYESAVGKNRELEQAQAELRRLNEQLEQRVRERTAELVKTNEKLELEIAERKLAQERIIHLNSVLRALRGVNQLITHRPDRKRLIQQSCELLVKTRGFLCGWILLFDEKRKYISAAVTGGKETRAFYQQLKRGDYPPCISKIMEHKDSLAVCGDIVENRLDCPPRSLYSGADGLISRLEYAGKVYGVISTNTQSDYSRDPEEQSLFRELAGDIAFALYNIGEEEKRKQLQEEIVYLASFPERNLSPVLESDREGNVRYQNPVAKKLFPDLTTLGMNHQFLAGWAQVVEEIQGSSWTKMITREVVVNNAIYEQIISPVAENQIRIYAMDITKRKHAEEALEKSEEKYRDLVTQINDGIFTVDTQGVLTFANRALANIHGLESPEEIMGKTFLEFVVPAMKEETADVFRESIKTGNPPKSQEISIIRKGGSIAFIQIKPVPVIENGTIVGFSGVIRDITEQRQMQEQLIMQDRLVSIGQLVSGVAHELNNPLTSVIGFSELLLQKELPDDVKADLKIVNDEAKRTSLIVKNLLSFARQQPQEKRAIDINEPIKIVLQLRSHEQTTNNIKVNTNFATNLPQIIGNSSQLQQVFFNIVTNAEQAMLEAHNKGTLTITTEQVSDIVRVSLADDGPGISPENMRKLFTPFFTTKEVGKGTGLGLSICHGIITDHGGKIYVESEPGKGTTFIVELPIKQAEINQEMAK